MTSTPMQTYSIRQEHLINGKQNTNYGSKSDGPTHVWVPADSGRNGDLSSNAKTHLTRVPSVVERGSSLTVHNIRYTVKVKAKGCCAGTEDKEILKNIDGLFAPGMNAILGPTGSGKSSLLDVLAGRKDPAGLSGTLLLDGCPTPENFKCMVGYVVQDDVVLGTLSVKENFHFSAALRLPSSVSASERSERVDSVVQELGLVHCADTKVGNEFIRGVSGGERKRCNIGMELITQPPVLFLDEPTTGLDASTANTVMLLLKQLSLRGRTIVFSIHQPRFTIFRLFDRLMLLSLGEVVYHGPSDESLDFFNSLGYPCQEHNNPPDFFLDVINGDPTAVTSDVQDIIRSTDVEKVKSQHDSLHGRPMFDSIYPTPTPYASSLPPPMSLSNTTRRRGEVAIHDKLVSGYTKSPWSRKVTSELQPILQEHERRVQTDSIKRLPPVEYATGFLTQFGYCSVRTLKNLLRNPATSVLQVATMIIFGLVVGAIYWQIDDSCKSGLQNRIGGLFFIIMNMVFGNLSAVELFIKERAIFLHENTSGFYRVSAYFLSTVVCDVIPMRLVPTFVFSAIVYFMLGLQTAVDKFFVFALGLFLVSMAASSIAFFFSAVVRIFAVANLLIAMAFVVMMVFSGLLVQLDSIPDFLEWLKYISIFRYSQQALAINELKDMTFNGNCTTGNEYLDSQGIAYATDWDLWVNFVAMGVIAVGFLIFSYLRLRFMNKLR